MKEYIQRSTTFADYDRLIKELAANGRTTGPNQSEAMVGYTRLNRQRMNRLEKTVRVIEEVREAAAELTRPLIWLIITEAWCGDAAQNIPVIEMIANLSDHIETRYILRDENPELMDQFLTDGARSIPKLIALDRDTLEVLGTWGARPAAAQAIFQERKAAGVEKPLIVEELQRWYNEDRGTSLQREFAGLIRECNARKSIQSVSTTA